MATTTYVPVEVYLRSSYEPDAEYVDGKIEERPMGEFDHASWQQAIHEVVLAARKGVGCSCAAGVAGSELRPTRYRVPDVTVLDRGRPIEQIITQSAACCF